MKQTCRFFQRLLKEKIQVILVHIYIHYIGLIWGQQLGVLLDVGERPQRRIVSPIDARTSVHIWACWFSYVTMKRFPGTPSYTASHTLSPGAPRVCG